MGAERAGSIASRVYGVGRDGGKAAANGSGAEDDRSVPVQEDPILGEQLDRPRESKPLDVSPDLGQRLGREGVIHPLDLLLNDRALVEVGGDKVRRRANQLDAARMRLVVRASPLETRKEGMVNVDDASAQLLARPIGEDLHVAGEHHEIDPLLFDELEHALLLRRFRVRGHRQVMEGDARAISDVAARLVIRDDAHDVEGQLSCLAPVDEVKQAVVVLRHENQRATMSGLQPQPHLSTEPRCSIDDE